MHPLSLLGSYRQYKHDTEVVASWLVSTSKDLGYSTPLHQASPATDSPTPAQNKQQPPGRLKGKARKQAKKSASAPTGPGPSSTSVVKHVLAIKDFLPIAEYIAAYKDKAVEIPRSFSSALRRVILARKSFSARLTELDGTQEDRESDRRHAYFVNVLESVQLSLSPLMAQDDTASVNVVEQAAPINKDEGTKIAETARPNFFAMLEVYDPSEDFLNAPDVVIPEPTETQYTMETPDNLKECLFALSNLLVDISRLRDKICKLWSGYRDNITDLRALAVATNTAIQLARSMEEAAEELFAQHGGSRELLQRVFDQACRSEGLELLEKQLPTDDYNFACYDLAKDLFFNAFIVLDAFRAIPQSKNSSPSYNGLFGWYDEHMKPVNNRQRYAQDKAALLEMLSDRTQLHILGKGSVVQDELTRGLVLMHETGDIPIWLCFAAQTHLDILQCLGSKLQDPLVYFLMNLKQADDQVPPVSQIKFRDAETKSAIREFHELAGMWIQEHDPLSLVRQVAGLTSARPNRFRRYNPLFCGMHLNYMRVHFHETGVKYAAGPGSLLSAVQLIDALETEGLLHGRSFTILEECMLWQDRSSFYVGDPPRDLEGYYKNWGLTRGISAANWVPTKRKGSKPQRSQAGIRTLKLQGPLSRVFAGMMTREWKRRTIDMAVLQDILDKLRSSEIHDSLCKEIESTDDNKLRKEQRSKSKQNRAGPVRTPVELIDQLYLAIDDETDFIEMDYFEAHHTSRRIMNVISEMCRNLFFDAKLVPALDDENHISEVVGLIFGALAGKITLRLGQDPQALLRLVAAMILKYHRSLSGDDDDESGEGDDFEYDLDDGDLGGGDLGDELLHDGRGGISSGRATNDFDTLLREHLGTLPSGSIPELRQRPRKR